MRQVCLNYQSWRIKSFEEATRNFFICKFVCNLHSDMRCLLLLQTEMYRSFVHMQSVPFTCKLKLQNNIKDINICYC